MDRHAEHHPAAIAARPATAEALSDDPIRRWLANSFSALAWPGFRLLFQGNLVTQVGMWMQQVAFGWLVLELTDSPFYLGLAGFFRALPMLVISPFGGVLADRLERKRLLIASQMGIMLFSGLLALMVALHVARAWHLLVASFLMGCAFSMNMPARQALIAQLVPKEQLPNAVALNSMSMNSSRVVGPALAGAVIGLIGVAGCLFLHAAAYLWSVFNVAAIKVPAYQARARNASVLQNLLEGFRYCYEQKSVFGMLALAVLTTIFGMQYMNLMPAFARDVLGMGPGGLGFLMTAVGVGAIVGSVAVANSGASRHRGTVLLLAAAAFGGALCLFALTKTPTLSAILLALCGASQAVMMALNQTILQQVVPDHLRGRVMSVYMVTWGMMPLGTLPAGMIAEAYGTPTSIFLGGLICYVGALWVFFFKPRFRSI
ncbi:MAG TPA: MFS transporter [Chloroflexota bacterium]|nr:MFS transporter [Chloroflexota bacterium]